MSGAGSLRSRVFASLALAACLAGARGASAADQPLALGGRTAWLHMPAAGSPRALIVVLHGGLGSAERLASGDAESAMNLDSLADATHAAVVYLNGTPAGPRLPDRFKAWNAGGCCGAPVRTGVDDNAYVAQAVDALGARLGVPPERRFAVGHSNGAMMIERVVCERGAFAAAITLSGPLQTGARTCPGAAGRRILAIHGEEDANVPIEGGPGGGFAADATFASERAAQATFRASGARYDLLVLPRVGHKLADIDQALTPHDGLAGYVRSTFALDAPATP